MGIIDFEYDIDMEKFVSDLVDEDEEFTEVSKSNQAGATGHLCDTQYS